MKNSKQTCHAGAPIEVFFFFLVFLANLTFRFIFLVLQIRIINKIMPERYINHYNMGVSLKVILYSTTHVSPRHVLAHTCQSE